MGAHHVPSTAGREACAPAAHLGMKRLFAKLSVFTALLVGIMLLFAIGAIAEDSLQTGMEIRPDTLTNPGTVTVNINVINMSDEATPISVTLLDPGGSVCSGFGSGGTAHLSPGASQSYTGTWMVTQEQLEKGRITYNARYAVTNANGERVTTNKPIAASIRHNTARASMKIDRLTPDGSVVEGQTVKISYQIANTGTVDILDIKIADPGITDEVVTYPLLKVGDSVELSTSYVAGTSSKTTSAKITYGYVVGDKTETGTVQAEAKVINVTIPDLILELTASKLTVDAGDKVDLTCVITNRSDLSYEQLKVTDKTLGDVESNLSLGSGKSHTITRNILVNETSTYQFVINGVDSTGAQVQFMSREVTIVSRQDTVDPLNVEVVPVVLDIVIEADREIIYSEPSPVIFHVKVTNNGLDTAENVIVAAAGKTIKTIPSVAPGEMNDFLIMLDASVGGQFQFTASAKNSQGETQEYKSNIFRIVFQATKPPPTPSPEPTAEPTEPPPLPDSTQDGIVQGQVDGERPGTGTILLYILFGLLIVILLAVALLFFMDHRRNNPRPPSGGGSGPNVVIDTIDRVPHRDYARAPKRAKTPDRKPPRRQEQLAPAYVAEDEDDDEGQTAQTPMREEPEEEPAPAPKMRTFDVAQRKPAPKPAEGEDNMFRRPAPEKRAGAKDDEEKGGPQEAAGAMEQTEVYGRDYLSRIRKAPEQASKAVDRGGMMSDEDAALLSGSTGQYRLSRRAGSVRGVSEPSSHLAEDPEDFARRQRAARSRRNDPNSFYDDGEDEDDDIAASLRRNR